MVADVGYVMAIAPVEEAIISNSSTYAKPHTLLFYT